MNIFETLKIALSSLLSNKMRSLLTMLGIIIGVASVIALQSIGQGTIDTATKKLEQAGTNLVTVQPSTQSVGGIALSSTNANLTLEDATAMADTTRVSAAAAVAPENTSGGQMVAGSKNTFGQIVGTTASYPDVRDVTMSNGEWFQDSDVSENKQVIVLGSIVATTLFGDGSAAVGQKVSLNRTSFIVVGVMNPKGGSGFGSLDNQVYIPVTTSQTRLTGRRPGGSSTTGRTISDIVMKSTNQNSVDLLISQATDLLRERHKISGTNDDFKITNQQDQLQAAKDQQATYNTFLIVIASISLFVGGIGIMNIMLVTVTERTREIGIRKAIGAKPFDILIQFMIESVTLCFVGGLVGVIFGIASSSVVDVTYQHTVVSGTIVIVAVAFAVIVGLFFGIYPARRASRLNPIDALRYD
ncbi:MAG: ABC transporter permease [Chloroflexota bacterium]|nr:ABC transporter permease [Chloroflexota bacterium]